jgi:hypothetical protein
MNQTTNDLAAKADVLATEHIELDANDNLGKDVAAEPIADASERRRLARKIDFRLIPMLAIVYAFSVIDRVNIGQVKTRIWVLEENNILTDNSFAGQSSWDDNRSQHGW